MTLDFGGSEITETRSGVTGCQVENRRTGCKKERTENLAKSGGLKSSAERINRRRSHSSEESLNTVLGRNLGRLQTRELLQFSTSLNMLSTEVAEKRG